LTDKITVVVKGHKKGKTTEAISLASKHWLCIVTSSRREQLRVAEKARTMGKDIPHPITWENFIRGGCERFSGGGFIIDDLDFILDYHAKGRPVFATMTQLEVNNDR